jgi:predicted amidophosphoribosyltransferase
MHYLICPVCQRSVPSEAGEVYCPNDGSRLLACCPSCNAAITSPYSKYCVSCGTALIEETKTEGDHELKPLRIFRDNKQL